MKKKKRRKKEKIEREIKKHPKERRKKREERRIKKRKLEKSKGKRAKKALNQNDATHLGYRACHRDSPRLKAICVNNRLT